MVKSDTNSKLLDALADAARTVIDANEPSIDQWALARQVAAAYLEMAERLQAVQRKIVDLQGEVDGIPQAKEEAYANGNSYGRAARDDDREAALPDDLRQAGWSVAIHNDYRLRDVRHTFWLLTKPIPDSDSLLAYKGEGQTDAEALSQIRALIREAVAKRQDRHAPPPHRAGDPWNNEPGGA